MYLCGKISAAFFKLESGAVKAFFQLYNRHPASVPYISGDTFRTLSTHSYETGMESFFCAKNIKRNEIVFCESWRLNEFFAGPARAIKFPYILVSTNGDVNIGDEWLSRLPDNLIIWFAQNVMVRHPKILPLPIGLENKALYWHGVTSDFEALRHRIPEKKSRILYGFTVGTNESERRPALDVLSKLSIAETLTRVNSREYRRILAKYQFVASPPGNGLDCHRTWEALYLGVIPIVRRSVAMEELGKLFPLWVVDDYGELQWYSEKDLNEKYNTLWNSPWVKEALWFDYWKKKIEASAVT